MGWKKRELPEWFKEIHGLELEIAREYINLIHGIEA